MEIKRTAIFKKNYKALAKKHYDMKKLEIVLQHIIKQEKEILRFKYKDHALKGQFKNLRELHIESNWLLIYKVDGNLIELWLLATGNHDDIFRYRFDI